MDEWIEHNLAKINDVFRLRKTFGMNTKNGWDYGCYNDELGISLRTYIPSDMQPTVNLQNVEDTRGVTVDLRGTCKVVDRLNRFEMHNIDKVIVNESCCIEFFNKENVVNCEVELDDSETGVVNVVIHNAGEVFRADARYSGKTVTIAQQFYSLSTGVYGERRWNLPSLMVNTQIGYSGDARLFIARPTIEASELFSALGLGSYNVDVDAIRIVMINGRVQLGIVHNGDRLFPDSSRKWKKARMG